MPCNSAPTFCRDICYGFSTMHMSTHVFDRSSELKIPTYNFLTSAKLISTGVSLPNSSTLMVAVCLL